MELRTLATTVLLSPHVAAKVRAVRSPLTDEQPGSPLRVSEPARLAHLRFRHRVNGPKLPKRDALKDHRRRGVAHHILANHELQAAEVMAAVLLACPAAPPAFRLELGEILRDEQRHTRMHLARCEALGVPFGSLPVNGHVWLSAAGFRDEAEYLAVLPLVFENRNLDESADLERQFRDAGDDRGAALLHAIGEDEVGHVAFGVRWLREFAGGDDLWEAWESRLHWPTQPKRAAGAAFDVDRRRRAGMDDAFIRRLRGESRR